MKPCCWMPPPRRCYEVIAVSIFREGSRPSGCPRPMRRGWLRRNRLTETLRCTHPVPEGFCFLPLRHISLVKSRSGGLGYSNAKTARLILPGAQNPVFCRWAIRTPTQASILSTRRPSHRGVQTADTTLTNQQGIIVRKSGANIVTRYKSCPVAVFRSHDAVGR